jgi:hypothetical protein
MRPRANLGETGGFAMDGSDRKKAEGEESTTAAGFGLSIRRDPFFVSRLRFGASRPDRCIHSRLGLRGGRPGLSDALCFEGRDG